MSGITLIARDWDLQLVVIGWSTAPSSKVERQLQHKSLWMVVRISGALVPTIKQ